MGLNDQFRIIHCKEYNDKREIRDEWWEVECFRSKWWSFGKRWFVETCEFWSTGGNYSMLMRFYSERSAFDYIGRVSLKVPKREIIREPIGSFI